jgi:hypothetical protein
MPAAASPVWACWVTGNRHWQLARHEENHHTYREAANNGLWRVVW